MESWPSGSQSGVFIIGSEGGRNVFCARMVKSSLFLLFLVCCATSLFGQQIPASQADGLQNPGSVDCSDPLQAGSSLCLNPNTYTNGQNAGFPLPSSAINSPRLD